MSKSQGAPQETFRAIFDFFDAPAVDIDCGQKCKHLNDGVPICCDTRNAVPIMHASEFSLLRQRSNLWRPFKPRCAATKSIVSELHNSCKAVECRGAQHCERDNRSLSCRTFPFFPYYTNKHELIGLAYHWHFEDRCWVISNLARVTPTFVRQFIAAHEMLFEDDPAEAEVYQQFSATMRRVFSRWRRPFVVIDRNCDYLTILPKGAGIRSIKPEELPVFEAYGNLPSNLTM